MTRDDIEARLEAVERAVTDGSHTFDGVTDAASTAARLDRLETTVEELDDRLAEVESAVEALRGYLGGVQAVNDDVEQRANAALAKAEALEAELVDDPHLRRERVDVNDAAREVADGASTDGGADDAYAGDAGESAASGRGGGDSAPTGESRRAADDDEPVGLAARVRDAL